MNEGMTQGLQNTPLTRGILGLAIGFVAAAVFVGLALAVRSSTVRETDGGLRMKALITLSTLVSVVCCAVSVVAALTGEDQAVQSLGNGFEVGLVVGAVSAGLVAVVLELLRRVGLKHRWAAILAMAVVLGIAEALPRVFENVMGLFGRIQMTLNTAVLMPLGVSMLLVFAVFAGRDASQLHTTTALHTEE